MLSLGELRNKKLGGGFKDRQDADWPGGGEVEPLASVCQEKLHQQLESEIYSDEAP